MIQTLKSFFRKNKIEQEQEVKTKIVLKQYRVNEPQIVHFKTENTIAEFKDDCIGTLCNRHLIHQKFNRVYNSDKPHNYTDYTDYPIYMTEHQIRKTETSRYTSDVKKVTCDSCLSKLKKEKK